MKKVFNFALYDFANSAFTTIIITFVFATYFATQIAPTPVLGQSYWGWTIGITGILVAVTGPFIGAFADKKNCVVLFIRFFTICCIFFTSFLWFAKPSENYLVFTLIIVALANFFYELSLIFYNSVLKDISKDHNLGKSSGLGFALGYIGGILILIICIKIFIDNDILPFGLSKENAQNIRATSIVVSIWYLIFSIPFLFNLKKKIKKKLNKSSNNFRILDSMFKNISRNVEFIDFIKSNAKTAKLYNYTKPQLIKQDYSFIKCKQLRHPIIERINQMVLLVKLGHLNL